MITEIVYFTKESADKAAASKYNKEAVDKAIKTMLKQALIPVCLGILTFALFYVTMIKIAENECEQVQKEDCIIIFVTPDQLEEIEDVLK